MQPRGCNRTRNRIRQVNAGEKAFAGRALQFQAAAMQGQIFRGQEKAEASAAVGSAQRRVGLIEGLRQVRQLGLRDADTVVTHFDHGVRVRLGVGHEPNVAAGPGEFERVRQ